MELAYFVQGSLISAVIHHVDFILLVYSAASLPNAAVWRTNNALLFSPWTLMENGYHSDYYV